MKSIRGKLWLGMMALVGVLLLLLWLLQIVFLERFYLGMRVNNLQSSLRAILQSAESGDYQQAIDRMDRLASQQNLTIEWLASDGATLHASTGDAGGQPPLMRNQFRTELYRRVMAGEDVQAKFSHPRFGTEYILLGLPLFTSLGGVNSALLATLPLAAVAETADILKQQLAYVSVLLLSVASLCAFWLARGFAGPILAIRKVLAAMAGGDFSARTEYKGEDEIGRLAESIDYLGERLAKLDQLRRDLVADVAHELRTPLTLIRGYAETIRDISGEDQARRDAQLAQIILETERLTELVQDNLQLAVLQSGNVELNWRDFCLGDLLQDTLASCQPLAEEKGVRLSLQGDSEARVLADEAKLEQVVRNLLQNSLQHTAPGGQVVVRVATSGSQVRVAVSDTGSGIAARDLPYIWEKFYRGPASKDATVRGTGLGLAIVKGILDAHLAQYGVDSEIGLGTTVWFQLNCPAN